MTLRNVRNDITTLKWMAGVNLALSLATPGAVLALACQLQSPHITGLTTGVAHKHGPPLILLCLSHRVLTLDTWKRSRSEAVGFTTKVASRKDKRGRPRMHTVCGLLMHSSLATTTDGLPLGMAAAKFWSRKKFKGTNALRRKINPCLSD